MESPFRGLGLGFARSASDTSSMESDTFVSPVRASSKNLTKDTAAGKRTPHRHEEQDDDLESLVSVSSSSVRRRNRHAARRALPPQFRPQMPTSARKAPSSPLKPLPSQRVGSIEGRSFYGGSNPRPKICLKMQAVDVSKKDAVSKSSRPTEEEKMVKRRRSSFKGLSSKRRGSMYEINKAVSHGIKPPKPAKISPAQKKAKTEESAPTTPSMSQLTPKSRSKSLFKITPSRVGALTSSVNYVVKNGQYQFIRRRSPRKGNSSYDTLSPSSSSITVRKTPKQLFTPSKSFLELSPNSSPARKVNRFIPSPVKFDNVTHNEDDETAEISNNVSGLIDTLDVEKARDEDDYAVYVTDDELSKVAWNAVQEIQSLSYSEQPEDENHTKSVVGDLQILRYEDDSSNEAEAAPSAVGSEDKENGSTLTTLLPSTPVRRTSPRKLISASTTPLKDLSTATGSCENSPTRLFSIFGKGANTGIQSSSTPPSSSKRRKFVAGSAKNDYGMEQMIIDAGQKVIGSQQCQICKFFYNASDAREVKLHELQHKEYSGIVSFPGWKNERLVQENPVVGLKIIRIKPGDPKRHWEKVEAVLEYVDRILGVSLGIRQPSRTEVFLAIVEKVVAGCLVAEPLLESDHLASSFLKNHIRVLSDDLQSPAKVSLCGVSRIWVHANHQRQGIASRMMEALRSQYRLPTVVQKDEIAFSHTSEMGAAFATKYLGRPEFLVYRPE